MAVQLLDQAFRSTSAQEDDIFYPSSDGEPMGETGIHVRAILYLYYALRVLFSDRPDIYVAADMFLYYQRGNPRAVKAPDVMFIKGVQGNHERDSFKTWVEGVIPAVIFEVTSPSTWSEDPGAKKALYEQLGVQEYFIFDPLEDLLDESFQGFRLVHGRYQPISINRDGTMTSHELGVQLRRKGILLRVLHPATGEPILWEREIVERLRDSEARAEQEAQRAEQEAQRAEQEAQRAEQEAQRAAEAEAENARLRALLQQMQNRRN